MENLNDIIKTVNTKTALSGMIVENVRTVYTEHWLEDDFAKVQPGDTFKLHWIDSWPSEDKAQSVDNGRGVVSVEYYNGEIEQHWADSFIVR